MVIANQRYRDLAEDLAADRHRVGEGREENDSKQWWHVQYEAACKGEMVRVERVAKIKGVDQYFDVAISPIREANQIIGAVVIARDNTAKHEYERALELAKDRAEELNKAKSSFLAHLAHEVRTPLNAIIGFASLIKMKNKDAELDRYSVSIVENSRRLAETTTELLSLAKLEAKKIHARMQEVDALLEIERAIEQILPLAAQKSLSIEFECKYSRLMLTSDPRYFRQIISNLLTNAIKFTDQGVITVLAAKRDARFAEIRVTDTGIGISEEHLPYIFDEFYQEPLETRDQNVGAGLGLSIIKKLCDVMEGDIKVESKKGEGSTFILGIPLAG